MDQDTGMHSTGNTEEGFDAVRKILYEDMRVPESLKAPAQTDSSEYLAHFLLVRAFASTLYVREVLDVFSAVSEGAPHSNTSVLYARALAELAALTYYLRKNVRDALQRSDLKVALEWAHKSFAGNRYLKQFTTPDSEEFKELPRPEGLEFADSLELSKATKCYSVEVLQEKEARQDYDFLSELAHPNSATLNAFLRLDFKNRIIHFSNRSADENEWDGYVLKYSARAGYEIVELIKLARQIDPNLNEEET
jgi:hypothetical protein